MSLEEKLMELHKLSMSQNRQVFSEDEKRLLQFHLSNLEYACGAPIAKVSEDEKRLFQFHFCNLEWCFEAKSESFILNMLE